MNSLELKVPPMLLALLLAFAMWVTAALLPSLVIALPWHRAIGAMLSCVGILFILAAGAVFRRAGTTVNPIEPDTTSSLVVSGVYGVSRNPMYAGALIVLAGWAVFLSHLLALVFLPAFVVYMNRFQIAPEERVLADKFGAEFDKYRNAVRRWL